MTTQRRSVYAAAMGGAMLIGAGIGAVMFGPSGATAQTGETTTTTATAGAPAAPADPTFKGNEDPAHETAETTEREAAEDAGKGFDGGRHHGFGPGGSNEDPAHEATESPERETQEHADTPAAPDSSGSSTTPVDPGNA
ncbi:MAG TPA: hypothetical protein VGO92_06325 [Acidimicrobiales bacterium]|jgi:hypothetical protein|nr:hypothetical protein [Acidimicrobiales bacterium]